MFAVFYKNQFKGLWHNQKDDAGWLPRTCNSLGWNAFEVEAYWYNYAFDARTVYIFDEDKNLCVQGPIKALTEDGKEMDAWGTVEKWKGEKYNG